MKKPTPVHAFHLSRVFLFVIVAATVMLVRANASHALELTYDKAHVLAYATSMSISDLLSGTNKARAENGLPALSLNAKLDNSAQMKANDMITYNYWSHVSPSGVQPWYWFDKAGYVYINAGENLAYGFSTGADVVAAWMNSPSHKANIIGDYTDVGFGIANGASYQGGEYTVVVAHYGKPQPAAVTAPTTVPATPATTTTQPASTPAPAQPQTTPPANVNSTETVTPKANSDIKTATTNAATTSRPVNVLDQLLQGRASAVAIAGIVVTSLASFGFVITHRLFFQHLIRNGIRLFPHVHHPVLDLIGIGIATGLILSTVTGHLL